MLQHCILLKRLWGSTVVESDEIINCQSSVENLPADEHIEWCSEFKLSVVIEKLLDLFVGIDFCNHQLSSDQRIHYFAFTAVSAGRCSFAVMIAEDRQKRDAAAH